MRALAERHPVGAFLAKRVASGLMLVLVVAVLVFAALSLLPGDVVDAVFGRSVTTEGAARLRAELGLDQSWFERLGSWFGGLMTGDLGNSLTSGRSVSELVGPRLGNSLLLAGISVGLLVPLSLATGAYAGVHVGGRLDRVISSAALAMLATPEFVVGAFLIFLLGIQWPVLPSVSLFDPSLGPLSRPEVLVLPALTLVLVSFGYAARIVRASVAETMQSPYVEAARLNGVPERRVIWRYGLRNSLAPSIQVLALITQFLVGGVLIVETIFQYPGLGLLLVEAAGARDIPVIQSVTVLLAAFYIGVNIVADLLIVLVTPRLRAAL